MRTRSPSPSLPLYNRLGVIQIVPSSLAAALTFPPVAVMSPMEKRSLVIWMICCLACLSLIMPPRLFGRWHGGYRVARKFTIEERRDATPVLACRAAGDFLGRSNRAALTARATSRGAAAPRDPRHGASESLM